MTADGEAAYPGYESYSETPMRHARSCVGASLIAFGLLLPCVGCGSGKPAAESSTQEAKVTGTVKVHGKPVTDGEVSFNPANVNRPDAGGYTTKIKPDGTYEITTLIGQNSISLSGPVVQKNPELSYGALSFDVQPGTNTYNIELPPPTPKP